MSVRTEWARAALLGIEILDEYVDQHGSALDDGSLGLALCSDEVFLIEAAGITEIRAFAQRILDRCDERENTSGRQ